MFLTARNAPENVRAAAARMRAVVLATAPENEREADCARDVTFAAEPENESPAGLSLVSVLEIAPKNERLAVSAWVYAVPVAPLTAENTPAKLRPAVKLVTV